MKPYWLAVVLCLIVSGGAGCSHKEDQEKKGGIPPVVKGLELQVVKSTAIPETVEVTGTVRARTSAVVSSRIPGTISVLKVREGDRVSRGQVLAQLDAQENQANAAASLAAMDESQQALEESLARKKLADATYERYRKLFDEQAITRQEFDTRQTEKDLAAQGVARAQARLKQAQAGSRATKTVAGYTSIIAPISGVVTSRQADLGGTVFPTQPLMTIEDEGSFQLELSIPERLAARVRPGMPVQVSLDAVSAPFDARIGEVVPAADPLSHTFIAKISLNRKGLRSGMFGRGAIAMGSSANGILLSQKGLVERGGLTSVWVVDTDNLARMRLVKTGKTVGDQVEIVAGLSDGERVVVSGVEKLSEGVRIEK